MGNHIFFPKRRLHISASASADAHNHNNIKIDTKQQDHEAYLVSYLKMNLKTQGDETKIINKT